MKHVATLRTLSTPFIFIILTLLIAIQGLYANTEAQAQTQLPDNFYPVSEGVFRSGQPSADNMQFLESSGFKSVLNLRQFHTDSSEAQGTQLQISRVPMDAAKINDDNIVKALKILKDAEKPVLIHCWHGSDRTGAVVAMYRLVFENAQKEDVIAELNQPKFGYHETVYPNIQRYLENVDIAAIKQRVFEN